MDAERGRPVTRLYVILSLVVLMGSTTKAGDCDRYTREPVNDRVLARGFHDIDKDGKAAEIQFVLVKGIIEREQCGLGFQPALSGHFELRVLRGSKDLFRVICARDMSRREREAYKTHETKNS
jgi:hypothetical protein